ncbi:MAG: 16S rRNA (cytosine(1402)-N(4))-methyltransferase RsmH [Alphaproteobacteria bacterium]|nr:16S rRNA (cytosine(1402)-N(4))-methyltransferase RsmH [Alphaproteobacteria bacterium]
MSHALHIPVMRDEMLAAVAAKAGDVVVDGTFGAGGYSRALLAAEPRARVIAFDRDPHVKLLADALARDFPGHFLFLGACFSTMVAALAEAGVHAVDAIVLDIGVSSMQFDEDARGFSFQREAPLDMRMSAQGMSAADVVNQYSEADLVRILRDYGEEKDARRITRAILAARALAPITTTLQLAEIIRGAVRGAGKMKIHPATRSFQALRIEVNQELAELEAALVAAEQLLRPGGRLVVITFHSLEDRIVKQFMLQRSNKNAAPSRHSPAALMVQQSASCATFELTPTRAITPTEQEVSLNPRARSAKLRCATRTASPLSHAA